MDRVQIVDQGRQHSREGRRIGAHLLPNAGRFQDKRPILGPKPINTFVNTAIIFQIFGKFSHLPPFI